MPGGILDRPYRPAAQADEAGRAVLHLDVSHLRDGGLPGPSLPAAEGQVFLGAGPCLYGSHLPDGVRHREPPEAARGTIARTVLYMADVYRGVYRLSNQDRRLMEAWDRRYPVDAWECTRARRIEAIQGNPNERVKEACRQAGL